jgi:hypothetical protein
MPSLTNVNIVLLTRPGALRWEDLPTVQALAAIATRHGVNLSAVTTDPIAGSLFTAVGLETSVVGASGEGILAPQADSGDIQGELAARPAPAPLR